MEHVKYKVGSVHSTNKYGDFIITKYVNASNVHIKFLNTGYEKVTLTSCILSGEIRDRYFPSVHGVGVVGEEPSRDNNGNKLKEYLLWNHMIARCYGEISKLKSPSYQDCTVSDNFKHYPFFKDWCSKQIGFRNKGWQLDKDILVKGNKIYSEDTCAFVPQEINSLFIKCDRSRGDLPLGVNYHKATFKFVAQISCNKKKVHLGLYDTVEEAFLAYKKSKEAHVKSIAEKYKSVLDPRVYKAMMEYVVELGD
ncbi:MAG: AP2 domain-containing protein [Erysipelotrichaceae bacterium]